MRPDMLVDRSSYSLTNSKELKRKMDSNRKILAIMAESGLDLSNLLYKIEMAETRAEKEMFVRRPNYASTRWNQ